MEYGNLLVENRDGIVIVTINRPKALNALNRDTLNDLKAFFGQDAMKIQGLKGVVLTGSGEKSFVAGADISEFYGLDAQGGLEMSQNSLRLSWTREEVDQRLHKIMSDIHESCVKYGKDETGFVDYVRGANIAGFVKVADAMLGQGVV
jgi:enoyl-CoA hydratase/carnithine racemase